VGYKHTYKHKDENLLESRPQSLFVRAHKPNQQKPFLENLDLAELAALQCRRLGRGANDRQSNLQPVPRDPTPLIESIPPAGSPHREFAAKLPVGILFRIVGSRCVVFLPLALHMPLDPTYRLRAMANLLTCQLGWSGAQDAGDGG
jgi:hypothetical protein